MDASDIAGDLAHVLLTEEQVRLRVGELARQIDSNYAGRDPLMVGVLNGAMMVMSDLTRAMKSHCSIDWMAISSYGSGTKSSGVVRILKDLTADINGRDVLIVEDIVDTGYTIAYLREMLLARHPASLRTCALLRKLERHEVDVEVDYLGFDIRDVWVVGYGLDFADRFRTLPYIGVVSPDGAAADGGTPTSDANAPIPGAPAPDVAR